MPSWPVKKAIRSSMSATPSATWAICPITAEAGLQPAVAGVVLFRPEDRVAERELRDRRLARPIAGAASHLGRDRPNRGHGVLLDDQQHRRVGRGEERLDWLEHGRDRR